MKCNNCAFEGEFKFCPQCGKKKELSVEERLEKLEETVAKLISKKENVFIPTKRKRKYERISGREYKKQLEKVAEIAVKKGLNIKVAFAKVFKREVGGTDYNQIRPIMKKMKRSLSHKATRPDDKRKARFTYIAKRSSALIKEGHTRQEAFKMASKEYTANIGKPMIRDRPKQVLTADQAKIGLADKKTSRKSFPHIEGVSKEMKVVLIDMVKGVIEGNKNIAKIDAEALKIFGRKAFTDFMTSMAFHLNGLADYFGVVNKFSFAGDGDGLVLRYVK